MFFVVMRIVVKKNRH